MINKLFGKIDLTIKEWLENGGVIIHHKNRL